MRNRLIKINSNQATIRDENIYLESLGDPEAMRSYNDDLVMSFAIGCWVRDTVIVEKSKEYRI